MVQFVLNGDPVSLDVDPQTPLLWAVRDRLHLMGSKFGCGQGLCGACTMHVDDEPVRTCLLPIANVAGKRVTTIEGLGGDHPVQQAWREENVPQCGYCQSGQIMSAVALLARNKQPNDTDIDQALAGNICRCGTYQRIRSAIHRAAVIAGNYDDFSPEGGEGGNP